MPMNDDLFGDESRGSIQWRILSKLFDVFTFVPLLIPILLLLLCVTVIAWRFQVTEYNADYFPSSSLSRAHAWRPFSSAPQPRYCSGCNQLISGFVLFRNMGHECVVCGVCAHRSCIRTCERMLCKTPGRLPPLTHQLREGNLNNNSVCTFCGVVCSSAFSLYGLECLWCHRTFHESCFDRAKKARQFIAINCDLGQLRHLVLPPSTLCLVPRATKVDHPMIPSSSASTTKKCEPSIIPKKVTRAASAPPAVNSLKKKCALPSEQSTPEERHTNDEHSPRTKDDLDIPGKGEGQSKGLVAKWRKEKNLPPSSSSAQRLMAGMLFRHGEKTQGRIRNQTKIVVPHSVVFNCRKPTQWRLIGFPLRPRSDDTTDPCKTWSDIIQQYRCPEKNIPEKDIQEETRVIEKNAGEVTVSPATLADVKKSAAFLSLDSARNLTETISSFAKQLGRGNNKSEEQRSTPADGEFCRAVIGLYDAVSDLLLQLEKLGSSPVIIFVNPKSGGRLGPQLLREFYSYFNPWQVVDMSIEKIPEESLKRFQALAITGRMTILVCGGDGTVSWIVDTVWESLQNTPSFATLAKLNQICRKFQETGMQIKLADEILNVNFECAKAPVAVLPLGTGNDLAKILHWGATFDSCAELLPFLRRLVFARQIPVDLWRLEVYGTSRTRFSKKIRTNDEEGSTSESESEKKLLMSRTFINYVDFGIAARIALKFHGLRETHPELFRSRLGNKFLYGEVGVRDYLVDSPINLEGTEIFCDGEPVDLTHISNSGSVEGLAVVNIPSFGGGIEPWKGRFFESSPRKGLLPRYVRQDEKRFKQRLQIDESSASEDLDIYCENEDHHLDTIQRPGIYYWRNFTSQKIHDGRIEIVLFRSLLHLGRVQVGLADAIKVAQGREIIIRLKNKIPYQVDGEPETLNPCEVRISRKCQTTMLCFSAPDRFRSRMTLPRSSEYLVASREELPPPPISQKKATSSPQALPIQRILQEAVDSGEISQWQAMRLSQRLQTS